MARTRPNTRRTSDRELERAPTVTWIRDVRADVPEVEPEPEGQADEDKDGAPKVRDGVCARRSWEDGQVHVSAPQQLALPTSDEPPPVARRTGVVSRPIARRGSKRRGRP